MDTATQYLDLTGGRLAFELRGPSDAPLVVLVPGMGDLRSTWREVTTPLAEAGYRIAAMDLRGHGDSSTTFTVHGDAVTGGDIIALVEHLGGPAVLVGSSMGAAAAVWASARRPDLVAGLVLSGPVLRDKPASAAARAVGRVAYRVLFARPWGAAAWAAYYRGPLHRGTPTTRLDEHVAAIRTALGDPDRLRSFRDLTMQLDHEEVAGLVDQVTAPTLAFVGDLDPDYVAVDAERTWLAKHLGAQVVGLAQVAHYPHHQAAELVVSRTLGFLAGLARTERAWATDAGRVRRA